MDVYLKGSSPCATTVGILILTRARQLGFRATVCLVGDPTDIVAIPGPALCYAPVMAGCGVGREAGHGAIVIVAGPPGVSLLATVTPHGDGGWFEIGRSGAGAHPVAQAFARLCNDPRADARALSRLIRNGMRALGLVADPAIFDVLCGAEIDPLTRVAIALRAGRALAGGRGEPLQRFLSGVAKEDPLPPPERWDGESPDMGWVLDGLAPSIRDNAEHALRLARSLMLEDGGRDRALYDQLQWLASVVVQLPPQSILPPLGAAEDSVATGIGAALAAEGDDDANRQLAATFRFLGGRYVSDHPHAVDLGTEAPPAGRAERWSWFGREVRRGRRLMESMWANLVDPPS